MNSIVHMAVLPLSRHSGICPLYNRHAELYNEIDLTPSANQGNIPYLFDPTVLKVCLIKKNSQ
jgi:hypothetical protein